MPGLPYTEKARQEAIARVLDSRIPIVQVAREVGCSIDTLHRWLRSHRQQGSVHNRQQGASQPTVNKTLHLPLPDESPSVIVRKNSHTKAPRTASQRPATFVPVNIIDARNHSVEIILPGNITLRLTDATPQYIAELLTLLASC